MTLLTESSIMKDDVVENSSRHCVLSTGVDEPRRGFSAGRAHSRRATLRENTHHATMAPAGVGTGMSPFFPVMVLSAPTALIAIAVRPNPGVSTAQPVARARHAQSQSPSPPS